ncbi:ABC transporter substrate-binding protein [Candidatus Epulonipiscium viviparus]|uniref:ABC transporter substrate-binding protein n=1 Tax=Candidatus Epulonipiscium viviparus TaxID=420336 RepID=UPI00016C0B23|nr:extracellular solute-binding protein [Candidatus Epulopiscium viviparus]
MKKFSILLSLGLMLALAGCSGEAAEVVKVYNWGDYIDESTNRMFEEETGIKVIYEVFPTNEEMYAKVANGNAAYDVIIPSDYMIEKMINEDLLAKIDKTQISNYDLIDREFIDLPYDPNNEYSVPYSWGTMGIVYNPTMIDGEIDQWADMWDPKYKNQIFMYDSERDSIMVALKMLGYSMNTRDLGELEEAKQALIEQKELVLAYVGDEGKGKMVNGEAAMMLAWAGDAEIMRVDNADLEYIIPKEGTNYFVDAMVVPKNGENYDNALKYIDFMCRPDVAAINMEYIGYSTPISEARALLPDEMKNSEIAYPDLSELSLEMFNDPSDILEVYSRIWTEVKAASK